MAYNAYYPASYQPLGFQNPVNPPFYPQNAPNAGLYGQGQTNTQPTQNASQNAIIWVSGEAGARGYPVAPNQTVQLWDSEAQTIYLKSADVAGMPSMKIIDYVIREEGKTNDLLAGSKQVDMSNFVTKEELEKRLSEIVSRETKKARLNEDE